MSKRPIAFSIYDKIQAIKRNPALKTSHARFLSSEEWYLQMREHPDTDAWLALGPRGDKSEITVTIRPAEPVNLTLRRLTRVLKILREQYAIPDTQPIKPTKVSPWHVWDERVKHNKSFVKIAQELTGIHEHPSYNRQVKQVLDQVRRAYQQAQRMMAMVEATH